MVSGRLLLDSVTATHTAQLTWFVSTSVFKKALTCAVSLGLHIVEVTCSTQAQQHTSSAYLVGFARGLQHCALTYTMSVRRCTIYTVAVCHLIGLAPALLMALTCTVSLRMSILPCRIQSPHFSPPARLRTSPLCPFYSHTSYVATSCFTQSKQHARLSFTWFASLSLFKKALTCTVSLGLKSTCCRRWAT